MRLLAFLDRYGERMRARARIPTSRSDRYLTFTCHESTVSISQLMASEAWLDSEAGERRKAKISPLKLHDGELVQEPESAGEPLRKEQTMSQGIGVCTVERHPDAAEKAGLIYVVGLP